MATEFEVDGKTYRVGKLNAINQFHLVRKIGPIIAKIGPMVVEMSKPPENSEGEPPVDTSDVPTVTSAPSSLLDMAKIIGPVLDALSEMKDEDVNYIVKLCLSVTQRQEAAGQWMQTWNTRAGQPQYVDINLRALIQIAINVIQENVGDFLADAPSISGAQMARAQGLS